MLEVRSRQVRKQKAGKRDTQQGGARSPPKKGRQELSGEDKPGPFTYRQVEKEGGGAERTP